SEGVEEGSARRQHELPRLPWHRQVGRHNASVQLRDVRRNGPQLSGAPKRKQTKSDRTKEIAKLLEGGAITIPAGTKMSLEGPIKGRKATLMIIDDPIMDRTERAREI